MNHSYRSVPKYRSHSQRSHGYAFKKQSNRSYSNPKSHSREPDDMTLSAIYQDLLASEQQQFQHMLKQNRIHQNKQMKIFDGL